MFLFMKIIVSALVIATVTEISCLWRDSGGPAARETAEHHLALCSGRTNSHFKQVCIRSAMGVSGDGCFVDHPLLRFTKFYTSISFNCLGCMWLAAVFSSSKFGFRLC